MSHSLFIPGRCLTTNRERKLHRLQAAGEIRETRRATALLARAERLPRCERIEVTVQPHVRDRVRQDLGACHPHAKAAIDGLVDAQVIPDDTDSHLVGLTFLPVVLRSELGDGLHLDIEEVHA